MNVKELAGPQDKLVLGPIEVIHRASLVRWLTILFALTLLPALAMAAPPLSPEEVGVAQQDPSVRIDPAQAIVAAGKTFTISVMIDEANDLGGFEFTLLYATGVVTVANVAVGDFAGSTGRQAITVVHAIDNQAGTLSLGVVTVGSGPGPGGTGELATITLAAQGRGESSLEWQEVKMVDTTAQLQEVTFEDGMVRVGLAVYLPMILRD